MIITNWTAFIVTRLARIFTKGVDGVTLWPFIFIWPKKYASSKALVKHEQQHLKQWVRYWIIGFLPVYIYWHCKVGYQNNPLEIEARKAEK